MGGRFTELEKALADSGIAAVNRGVLRGDPTASLTAYAKRTNADLIALGRSASQRSQIVSLVVQDAESFARSTVMFSCAELERQLTAGLPNPKGLDRGDVTKRSPSASRSQRRDAFERVI